MPDQFGLPTQEDYLTSQIGAGQARNYATQLRNTKGAFDMPQAQMVGGQYIRPHPLQYLAPIFNQWMAGQANQRANTAEMSAAKQQATGAEAWRSQFPQWQQKNTQVEAAGPPEEGGVQPSQTVTTQVPPSRDTILKYSLAGLANPLTSKEAMLTHQDLTNQVTRSEDMAYKDYEARLKSQENLQVRRESLANQLAEVKMRLEDKTLDRGERERLAKMHDETQRALAASNLEMHKTVLGNTMQQQKFREEDKMRSEVLQDPVVKEAAQGATKSADILKALGPGRDFNKAPLNIQEQIALKDAFQQVVNPRAAARLGMLKYGDAAMPIGDQLAMFTQILTGQGGKLTPKQSGNMRDVISKLAETHRGIINERLTGHVQLAKTRGLDESAVVPPELNQFRQSAPKEIDLATLPK